MPAPKEIAQPTPAEVHLTWADGHESPLPAALLRRACPCAGCIHEWTGEQLLAPDSVAEDLEVSAVRRVGLYALQFVFSDRHDTGIYTWDRLRELCPCPACSPR